MQDHYHLLYYWTNESLEAIVTGLDINKYDRILSIAGSGDQPFALLEKAQYVTVVDDNPEQIRFIRERKNLLEQGDYKRFLKISESILSDTLQNWQYNISFARKNLRRRNKYFKKHNRLKNIQLKLANLQICDQGNIFKIAALEKGFTKIYLSNAINCLNYNKIKDDYKIMKNTILNLPKGGLIYFSNGKFASLIIKHYYDQGLILELELDEEHTSTAMALEYNWKPSVYKRI